MEIRATRPRKRQKRPWLLPRCTALDGLVAALQNSTVLFSALFFASVLLAALPWAAAPAYAQDQLVESTGTAYAPIYEDNVDAARSRAVRNAQHEAVLQVLQKLLAPEWMALFNTELKGSILKRAQTYITSYRIDRLEPSLDRTRYRATLSAQVNRGRIVSEVHALFLPVIGDPLKQVQIFYAADDSLLSGATPRKEVLQALQERLALLNFNVAGFTALQDQEAELFGSAAGDATARGAWLSRRKLDAGLFLAFSLGAKKTADEPRQSEASAQLFQARDGVSLGVFTARTDQDLGQPEKSASDRRTLMAKLVTPLVAQLQPGGVRAFGASTGKSAPLEVRLLGMTKVEDEEAFAQSFFRQDAPFSKFYVSRLDSNSVSYRGSYQGDRKALELDLPGKTYGDFRITKVFWFNDVLELQVARDKQSGYSEPKLFPQAARRSNVADLLATFLTDNSDLPLRDPEFIEVEDNGWLNRSNKAPFNTSIYGFIDSRRDSDFFVAEELKEGEEIVIFWYRVGRTSLDPAIRIYNGEGQPIRFYYPKNWIRSKYKVPKGQHKVFIEVSDRFSGIRWDSGGYLNYHYLLVVERKEKD